MSLEDIYSRDSIYVPKDIPETYKYGIVNRDYVQLYDRPSVVGDYDYYTIYYNYSPALYTKTSANSTYVREYQELPVSRKFLDRPDAFNILAIVLMGSVVGIWLFNFFTSAFKKGGFFGGLF